MAFRCRRLLYAASTILLLWFLITYFCLSQIDNNAWPPPEGRGSPEEDIVWISAEKQDSRSDVKANQERDGGQKFPRPTNSLDYMKYFHLNNSKHSSSQQIDTTDTLFYQFNPILNYSASKPLGTNKPTQREHELETRKLGIVSNMIDKYVETEGFKLFAFNVLVSNRIGLFRALPDTRHPMCSPSHDSRRLKLKASIVICYYNEAPSSLLRSVYTILLRTPRDLIEEIIIVDDFSDTNYNLEIIKPFIKEHSGLVKISRTERREGLIRARLFGASSASGEVLVFLDSHVEANQGWLEPLLEAIQRDNTTVACPMIDLINYKTLVYSASPMVKGGFRWNLNFRWDSVESEHLKTYDDFVRPIESPSLAGGLYAIRREYFYQLGSYDSRMNLWGGENVEMSLRTWMCGGRILILPCSRFGHIFRKTRPYGPEANQPDSLLYNSHRAARVWLDGDNLERFYEASPEARNLDSGPINERLLLKRQLKCKSFDWYLDQVYPKLREESEGLNVEQQMPVSLFKGANFKRNNNERYLRHVELLRSVRERIGKLNVVDATLASPKVIKRFQIQSVGSNLCIESKEAYLPRSFTRLVLNECANRSAGNESILPDNQLFSETELHDYRLADSNQCLDLEKNFPLLRKCHNMGSFQNWTYDSGRTNSTVLYNTAAGLCLGVEKVQRGEPIIVINCDRKSKGNSSNGVTQFLSRPTKNNRPSSTRLTMNVDAIEHLKPSLRWTLISANNRL